MTPCTSLSIAERIQALADSIWHRKKLLAEGTPGICRICGCDLPYAYHVIKGNRTHDVKLGTAAAARAVKIIDNPGTNTAMVIPLTMCEVMCDRDMYQLAQSEVIRRRRQWQLKQASNEAKTPDTVGCGRRWS